MHFPNFIDFFLRFPSSFYIFAEVFNITDMKVNTIFNIGDYVYYIDRRKIALAPIESIKIYVEKHEGKVKTSVWYCLNYQWYREFAVFETEEEIVLRCSDRLEYYLDRWEYYLDRYVGSLKSK